MKDHGPNDPFPTLGEKVKPKVDIPTPVSKPLEGNDKIRVAPDGKFFTNIPVPSALPFQGQARKDAVLSTWQKIEDILFDLLNSKKP